MRRKGSSAGPAKAENDVAINLPAQVSLGNLAKSWRPRFLIVGSVKGSAMMRVPHIEEARMQGDDGQRPVCPETAFSTKPNILDIPGEAA
jgi:hypothetical protein